MIAKDLAIKKRMNIAHNVKTPTFATINGAELQIDGTVAIDIENLHNGIRKMTMAIVSPDVSNDILIGYPQLKELGVIKKTFPLSAYRSISNDDSNDFEKIKTSVCDEFPDVIRDTLPDKAMDSPLMKISLTDDARPYKILTARPIPRHYQTEADKLIHGLIDDGIIARVEGTTEWTAPAFLVPKNKRLE